MRRRLHWRRSRVKSPTVAAAQAALQEAQSAQHGLHAEREDLVAAYYDAVECADGDGMVDVRRRLFEVDEKVAAAGVVAERAAVELAQAESRTLVSLMAQAKEEVRSARERWLAARGNARIENAALVDPGDVARRARVLGDEQEPATQRLSRARIRRNKAIAAARQRID
jgi:hypothetical protein